MAYNREVLVLQEPLISFGAFADLDTLTPADNPLDPTFWTPGGNFGYIRMGTIEITITDESVEYLSGTPHEEVRRDLLRRTYMWKFTGNQAEMENFQKFYNLYVESGAYNFGWIGLNTPVRPYIGMVAQGRKVDGSLYNFGAFYAQNWIGDNRLSSPGTDYTDLMSEWRTYRHPSFAVDPDNPDAISDMKAYGLLWEPVGSSTSSGS